jgi:SNF2 family DNA or RNA helicase
MCKKCDTAIPNKTVRVGLQTDTRFGLLTKWQHLGCTIFKNLTDASTIEGWNDLSAEQQAQLQERVTASAGEEDLDDVAIDPDELVRKAWSTPKEPPSDLLMPLLPYQKEGLGWMSNQEHVDVHGGILADEMGMGKTIQAIALILDNRPEKDATSDAAKAQRAMWDASDVRHGSDPRKMPKASTLVVVPTIALRQWQMEISRFTAEGALSVKVYHGENRSTTVNDLRTADVVMTTYAIMESEYRKATAGAKVRYRTLLTLFRLHRTHLAGSDDIVMTSLRLTNYHHRRSARSRAACATRSSTLTSCGCTGSTSAAAARASRQRRRRPSASARSCSKASGRAGRRRKTTTMTTTARRTRSTGRRRC